MRRITRRSHDNRERQRVILQDPGHVGANRLRRLREIGHDLVIGPQRRRRRDHYAGGARRHRRPGERPHGGEARGGDADDDRQACPADDAGRDRQRLRLLELLRLSHDAEHCDARAAGLAVEIDHAVDGGLVDAAVLVERGRRDGIDALGGVIEHGGLTVAGEA